MQKNKLLRYGELPDDELVEVLASSGKARVERIISSGQSSPEGFWYDQDENEYVLLLSGSACLDAEGERIELREGDGYLLPKHVRHRVVSTSSEPPCVWICFFFD